MRVSEARGCVKEKSLQLLGSTVVRLEVGRLVRWLEEAVF